MENIYKVKNDVYQRCKIFGLYNIQSAGNIGRKVSRTLGIDLSRLSRALLTAPQRISLWSANGKVKGCGFCPS